MDEKNEELEYFDALTERDRQAKAQMDAAFDDQTACGQVVEVSNKAMRQIVEEARQKALAAEAAHMLVGGTTNTDWDDRNLRSQALEAALRTNPIDPPAIVQTAEAFYLFLKGEQADG